MCKKRVRQHRGSSMVYWVLYSTVCKVLGGSPRETSHEETVPQRFHLRCTFYPPCNFLPDFLLLSFGFSCNIPLHQLISSYLFPSLVLLIILLHFYWGRFAWSWFPYWWSLGRALSSSSQWFRTMAQRANYPLPVSELDQAAAFRQIFTNCNL